MPTEIISWGGLSWRTHSRVCSPSSFRFIDSTSWLLSDELRLPKEDGPNDEEDFNGAVDPTPAARFGTESLGSLVVSGDRLYDSDFEELGSGCESCRSTREISLGKTTNGPLMLDVLVVSGKTSVVFDDSNPFSTHLQPTARHRNVVVSEGKRKAPFKAFLSGTKSKAPSKFFRGESNGMHCTSLLASHRQFSWQS